MRGVDERAGRVADRGAGRRQAARNASKPRELLVVQGMLGLVGARKMRQDEVERELVEQILRPASAATSRAVKPSRFMPVSRCNSARPLRRASARLARGSSARAARRARRARRRCSASAPSNTSISAVGREARSSRASASRRDEKTAATFAQQPPHDGPDAEPVRVGFDDGRALRRRGRSRSRRKLRASASRSMRSVAGRSEW